MANSFGILEATLNEIGEATTTAITDLRLSPYQPIVVRATDHDDDKGTNCTTEEELLTDAALFVQAHVGAPFTKDVGLKHIIHQAAATPAVPTDVTVLFPNYDYSTFE